MMTTILALGGFVVIGVVVMVATAAMVFAPELQKSASPSEARDATAPLSHRAA